MRNMVIGLLIFGLLFGCRWENTPECTPGEERTEVRFAWIPTDVSGTRYVVWFEEYVALDACMQPHFPGIAPYWREVRARFKKW